MEDFSAGQSLDANGPEQRAALDGGDPFDPLHADDPLGDEAAFPTTWQHLTSGVAPHD